MQLCLGSREGRFVFCGEVFRTTVVPYLVETREETVHEVHHIVRVAAGGELLKACDVAKQYGYFRILLQHVLRLAPVLKQL